MKPWVGIPVLHKTRCGNGTQCYPSTGEGEVQGRELVSKVNQESCFAIKLGGLSVRPGTYMVGES